METSPLPRCGRAVSHMKCGRSGAMTGPAAERQSQEGWALLGLILALTIMGIMMVGIMPNVQLEVRRDKEEEMMFRGQEMAEGIARYYNLGQVGPINLSVPPPYGYLTDLKKLSEGVILGAIEKKFVRGSAMLDPMVSKDWVPVRARDPRLMPMLQAYAAANLTTIPPSYMALAAAPVKTHFLSDNPAGSTSGSSQIGAVGGNSQIGVSSGSGAGQTGASGVVGQSSGQNRPGAPRAGAPSGKKTEGDDDDDDDDDDTNDPLGHLLKNDLNNMPIVGVAPNLKGPCVHPIYGITRYEQWVFIYLPPANLQNIVPQTGPRGQGLVTPVTPRVSQ